MLPLWARKLYLEIKINKIDDYKSVNSKSLMITKYYVHFKMVLHIKFCYDTVKLDFTAPSNTHMLVSNLLDNF